MKLVYWPIMAVLSALPCAKASSAIYYVDLHNPTPVAPYTNWLTAATNIQDAIDAASAGDSVVVSDGVYGTGGRVVYAALVTRVVVDKAITVQSVNGPGTTSITGSHYGSAEGIRCVYLAGGATLTGFTLKGGGTFGSGDLTNEQSGAAVWCESNTAVLSNCVLTASYATYNGGGAYQGTLLNCVVTNNGAYGFGGGTYGADLNSCVIIKNKMIASPGYGYAGNGGGSAFGVLSNCLIQSNSALGGGGGAYSGTLSRCFVISNSAAAGGGAFYGSLNNCLVFGNEATGIGGGGTVFSALNNCTVVGNTATNGGLGGGGVFDGGASNCIVYHNSAVSGANFLGAAMSYCDSFPLAAGPGNITNDPVFVNLAGGDFHLQSNSPCINAGNNTYVSSPTDLDGNARIVNGVVDIGAYEFQGNIRYVSLGSTNPIAPYSDWSIAATNIQDAIDTANAGDSVVVSNGVYGTGGRVVYAALVTRVVVDKAVTVQSVNGPGATIITGSHYGSTEGIRCVYLAGGATLIGFTLKGGGTFGSGDLTNEQSGAAVWCESNTAVLSNCVLTACFATGNGGGAYRGTLLNCVVTNNVAYGFGGGTYGADLNDCVIIKNRMISFPGHGYAGNGGGSAFGVLSNCLIQSNSALGGGGGAYSGTLSRCFVISNSAAGGGGAFYGLLNNCLVFGNEATGIGGGGTVFSALNNCTVVGNTATNGGLGGGGVFDGGATNCIVYHNSAVSGANFLGAAMSYCDSFPLAAGPGNITNDPAFVNLAGGDFHLQSNSPCINAGHNAYVTTTNDLDGNPRIAGGTVDIGAYEYQTPTSIISYAWLQQFGLPTDGSADYLDSDGDGLNNWQEWIAGTNPTNALSVLKMTSATATNSPAGLVVTWQSVSGITYFLQSSSNLGAQPAFSTIQTNIPGLAGTTSYTDTNATGSGPYFYRVGVGN